MRLRSSALPWALTCGGILGITSLALASEAPGAFELLRQVRAAYADLDAYADLGEIERVSGEDANARLQFFETALRPDGGLLWRTHGETENGFEERVIWSDGREAFVYSSVLGQYKPISSVAAELAHGFGDGGYDALVVPLLLAGEPDALADPDGATVEGPETCGESECWLLTLTRMAGTIESELRIDRESFLIRSLEVRSTAPSTAFACAPMPATGSGRTAGAPSSTITVRHHPAAAPPRPFAPPDGTRRVADWEPVAEGGDREEDPWVDLAFMEEITVSLFSVVARIVDSRGEPLLGLKPSDLIARVGDHEVPILSLDWSSSSDSSAAVSPLELADARARGLASSASAPPSAGRLIVLFLQVDLEPSRIGGHLKLLPEVRELVRSLSPQDRVAIVSFDSHLKLWQDFSRDREATSATLEQALRYGTPAAQRSRHVSLLATWDARAARDAASPERALQLTAEALSSLPGEKDLVYLGWGLGRYGAGGVRMTPDYEPAVRALDSANATVFVLDVSQSDQHSLEIGLQNVAAQTGGTYARTFRFASQAVHRLARTLNGHYVVSLDRSALPEARGRLSLRLRDRQGRVLFKPLILG